MAPLRSAVAQGSSRDGSTPGGVVALLDLVVQEFQACLLWPPALPEFGQADPGPVGIPIVQPEPLADDFLGGQRSVA